MKKIKNFFSKLMLINVSFTYVNKTVIPKITPSNVTVYHVEDGELLHASLGISDERFDVLRQKINTTYTPTRPLTDMICELSTICNDPQELAVAMFIFGSATEKMKNPAFWEKYL